MTVNVAGRPRIARAKLIVSRSKVGCTVVCAFVGELSSAPHCAHSLTPEGTSAPQLRHTLGRPMYLSGSFAGKLMGPVSSAPPCRRFYTSRIIVPMKIDNKTRQSKIRCVYSRMYLPKGILHRSRMRQQRCANRRKRLHASSRRVSTIS